MLKNKVPTKKVTIPVCEAHEGFYAITVELNWVCPVCGGPRGEVVPGRSYDGSLFLEVDTWKNPCGHIDKYSAVRREIQNKLKKDLDELIKYEEN